MSRIKKDYSFLDLAEQVLEKTDEPLSAKSIIAKANEYGFRKVETKSQDPALTLNSSLYQDIIKPESKFYIVTRRPICWGLKAKAKSYNAATADKTNIGDRGKSSSENDEQFNERDLHRLLISYVRNDPFFGRCLAKTIYHEESTGKQKKNQHWIHPDIVGVTYPFGADNSYGEKTLSLMKVLEHNETVLYSFEMKISIDSANQLREAFFQAVSNSSWANQGYLVAIKYDDNVLDEMRSLNQEFGIGFIRLGIDDYRNSEVILPSRQRTDVDWDMVERLIQVNPGFNEFIEHVTDDLEQGKILREEYFSEVFADEKDESKCMRRLRRLMSSKV